jgi:hypothetical protein
VGHSLGAGVAALLVVFLLKKNEEVLGGINPESIRALAIAPPRVVTLDLAIKYAGNLNCVIYQVHVLSGSFSQLMNECLVCYESKRGRLHEDGH